MPVWAKPLPSQEYLLKLFSYDPENGELRWRNRWAGKHHAGQLVGRSEGYRRINLDKQLYLVHRIIWKLMTGDDPPTILDHIDCNPQNNRWSNLRPATSAENLWNRKTLRNNTSGYPGVSFHEGKWRARISIAGKPTFLGHFPNPEEAIQAYEAAVHRFRGHFLGP